MSSTWLGCQRWPAFCFWPVRYLMNVIGTGNFTCLEIVFSFRRRLGYYLFHTYVPTCLIVIMSWISFWIRPEAVPARVTLGVTSLLTLSTQHANSQKALPPVSYIKVRRILIFFQHFWLKGKWNQVAASMDRPKVGLHQWQRCRIINLLQWSNRSANFDCNFLKCHPES